MSRQEPRWQGAGLPRAVADSLAQAQGVLAAGERTGRFAQDDEDRCEGQFGVGLVETVTEPAEQGERPLQVMAGLPVLAAGCVGLAQVAVGVGPAGQVVGLPRSGQHKLADGDLVPPASPLIGDCLDRPGELPGVGGEPGTRRTTDGGGEHGLLGLAPGTGVFKAGQAHVNNRRGRVRQPRRLAAG